MCGIVGYISERKYDEDIILCMRDAMAHRGPDDYGMIMDDICGRQVALAHRRLSIRDLSANGAQPMCSEDKNVVIVYNGEIYNSDEIKNELIEKGHKFKSHCDTEVILEAYIEWGCDSVQKLNGMFAYAILDKGRKQLHLFRDRMGEKPLYYSFLKDGFAFASEIAGLVKHPGYKKEVDQEVLASYLWQMYIPAPRAIYKDTYKLESGCFLTYDLDTAKTDKKVYWSPDSLYMQYENRTKEEYIEDIENCLTDSIRMRLVSDVPLGVFLSGGIDSSLIAALGMAVAEQRLDTFSIGFQEEDFNEAKFAKKVAEHLGTNHHEMYCSVEDAKEMITCLPKVYSEPFADNSQLPTMILSRYAHQSVKVALSGDGGDELFYGYPSYKSVIRNRNLKIPGVCACPIAAVANVLMPYHDVSWKINKIAACSRELGWFEQDLIASAYIREGLFRDQISTFYSSEGQLQYQGNVEERMLNLGLKNCLQEDMLTKVDRAAMAYSLETRAPFLDHRLVELSQRIRPDMKCFRGQFKYLLREILYKYVPKELIDRPKKGFGVPINQWLHEDFTDLVGDYLAHDFIVRQGIFNPRQIERLYCAFSRKSVPAIDRIVWCLLVFQMWWEEWK